MRKARGTHAAFPSARQDPAPGTSRQSVCLGAQPSRLLPHAGSSSPGPARPRPLLLCRTPGGNSEAQAFFFHEGNSPSACRHLGSIRQGTLSQAWSQLSRSEASGNSGHDVTGLSPPPRRPLGEAADRWLLWLESPCCLRPDPSAQPDFISRTARVYLESTVRQALGKTFYRHCLSLHNTPVKSVLPTSPFYG